MYNATFVYFWISAFTLTNSSDRFKVLSVPSQDVVKLLKAFDFVEPGFGSLERQRSAEQTQLMSPVSAFTL